MGGGGVGVASTYVRGLKIYFDMIFILDLPHLLR